MNAFDFECRSNALRQFDFPDVITNFARQKNPKYYFEKYFMFKMTPKMYGLHNLFFL